MTTLSRRNVQLTSTVKTKSSRKKGGHLPALPSRDSAWRKHLLGPEMTGSGSSSGGGGSDSTVSGGHSRESPVEGSGRVAVVTNNNDIEMPEYIVDLVTRTTYLKGKFLGKGGYARVHELTDLTTNRVYAGKIIAKSHITQPHHKEKIDREVGLQRTFCHRHVVQFHHYFEDELNVYIILEYCPKKSLVHVMKQRSNLTEPEVRYYMRQLVDGVHYLHGEKVIHRDLKLGNMFLTDEMIMKIGDFGLATRIDPTEGPKKPTICGTPNYIAPEVLNNMGHTFSADVWAMGCIMYAMLVGQPPFETATLTETYVRIMTNRYVIPPLISDAARSLIAQLLHPVPSERPSLDAILEHPFFTSGYSPNALSPACCTVMPKFPEEPVYAVPIPTPGLVRDLQKVTSGMARIKVCSQHRSVENVAAERQRRDKLPRNLSLKEVNPRKEKEASIHSAIRQKITSVLCPDKALTQKRLKACSAATLFHVLSTCWDNMPDEVVVNPPCVSESPIQFVVKWIDYSNKYGFGFQLSDHSVGVLFNDNTKIGFNPSRSRLVFIDLLGKMTVVSASSVPAQLHERHTLLRFFAQYMDENLTEGGETKDVDWGKRKSPIPYMKRWLRTNRAVIMQLSTGTLQVNFFLDHTKIILSLDKSDYLVTYINEARRATTYRLLHITNMGCSIQIRERLLYALNVLKEFASLEGDAEDAS